MVLSSLNEEISCLFSKSRSFSLSFLVSEFLLAMGTLGDHQATQKSIQAIGAEFSTLKVVIFLGWLDR